MTISVIVKAGRTPHQKEGYPEGSFKFKLTGKI